jgi:hypothetical protein
VDNAAMSHGYEAEGQLATVSRELLLAVAADDAQAACARSTALARGVLESPVVALASAVLRGGPLAMTKAIALAERVLEAGGRCAAETAASSELSASQSAAIRALAKEAGVRRHQGRGARVLATARRRE